MGAVTEVVPVACSATIVGINAGDTLAVDYRFTISPDLAFTTIGWRADLTVDYGWIRVFAAYDGSDQTRVSGHDDGLLDDVSLASVGAELRRDREGFTASILGEARRYTSTRLSYDSARLSESLSVGLVRDLTLLLVADQSLDDYRSQDRTSGRVAGRATLTWLSGSDVFAELTAGAQYLDDSLFPTERVWEAGLRARWRVRQLEISPSVFYYDRQRGDVETRELRAILQVIRRF